MCFSNIRDIDIGRICRILEGMCFSYIDRFIRFWGMLGVVGVGGFCNIGFSWDFPGFLEMIGFGIFGEF